jgi:hypothetical protein
VETFTFAIAFSGPPDALELLEALSGHVSRYIGLNPDEAAQAKSVLNRLVADRLARTCGPVRVVFDRSHAFAPVSVEIISPAIPGDTDLASPGGGVVVHTDGRESRLRLSWTTRADE